MCLAVPMQVLTVDKQEKKGEVEIDGVRTRVDLSLVEADIGDYVIVHAGFAIQKLDEAEAKKTLALFNEIAGLARDDTH